MCHLPTWLKIAVGICALDGHRGLTPDACALDSQAECQRQCEVAPERQHFGGWEQGVYCVCCGPHDGYRIGSEFRIGGDHYRSTSASATGYGDLGAEMAPCFER